MDVSPSFDTAEVLFTLDQAPGPPYRSDLSMQMDHGPKAIGSRIKHHCFLEAGRLCCDNAEHALQKTSAAFVNLMLGHAIPSGTLARWTHVTFVDRAC